MPRPTDPRAALAAVTHTTPDQAARDIARLAERGVLLVTEARLRAATYGSDQPILTEGQAAAIFAALSGEVTE